MSHAGLFERGTADQSASSRDSLATATSRRLSAILAADVAGYSRLMGADEERTHERLKAHRRQVVDPKIKEHTTVESSRPPATGCSRNFLALWMRSAVRSRCSGRWSTGMPR